MRKSLIMGTKEDVSRMRSRNLPSKRKPLMTDEELQQFIDAAIEQNKRRIETFNHPILGNN